MCTRLFGVHLRERLRRILALLRVNLRLFSQTNRRRVRSRVSDKQHALGPPIRSGLAPAFSMSDTLTNTQTDKHSH